MTARLSPQAALSGHDRSLPAPSPCVHCAGRQRRVARALTLPSTDGPLFDVAADRTFGAPVGREREPEPRVGRLLAGAAHHDRAGARVHDLPHPASPAGLQIPGGECGDRLASPALPPPESAAAAPRFADAAAMPRSAGAGR